jgi:hypothetical protein
MAASGPMRAACVHWMLLSPLVCDAAAPAADAGVVRETVPPAVVVTAQRPAREQQVREFVADLTRRVDDEQSPPLWHRRVCPLAAGFTRDQGEYVLQRLSQVALAVGAPLDQSQCRPNLYVILTDDPESFLASWRGRVPTIFRGASQAEIERFVTTARPVRVWHVAGRIGADGEALVRGDIGGAVPATGRLPNSRLERGTVLELRAVVVVIDAVRVRGRPLAQLVDYVAMVGLAELRNDRSSAGAATVLAVFDESGGAAGEPAGLTDWDLAFLKALYGADPKAALQRALVVDSMLRELGH